MGLKGNKQDKHGRRLVRTHGQTGPSWSFVSCFYFQGNGKPLESFQLSLVCSDLHFKKCILAIRCQKDWKGIEKRPFRRVCGDPGETVEQLVALRA